MLYLQSPEVSVSILSIIPFVVFLRLQGWRIAFFSAGVLSLFAAALVQIVAKEPRRHSMVIADEGRNVLTLEETENIQQSACFELYRRCSNFCRAALSRTFLLLLLQGICGYIPLHAFQFYTLYFQYVGMPDWQASLLTACPLVGGLLGSLFGGWLGDQAERFNAFHGRPLVGQLGTLLALPLIYIGLLGIPRRPDFFGLYAIDMLFLGQHALYAHTYTHTCIYTHIHNRAHRRLALPFGACQRNLTAVVQGPYCIMNTITFMLYP